MNNQSAKPTIMPARLAFTACGIAVWVAALVGSVQLHRVGRWLELDLCGPWGCAAAPEALVGYHLFLTLLIAPAAVLIRWALPANWRVHFAGLLVSLGLALAVVIGLRAAVLWQEIASDAQQVYLWRWAGFVVVTTPDVPALPLTIAGAACLTAGLAASRRRTPRGHRAQSVVDAAETQGTR
ncbi:MAG: hypothetical protein AAF589_07175 [Planctomycetota bacterium]